MAQIFISYSRNDEDFARNLAASLSNLGADVWIDVEDIPAGMKWSAAIQQGLKLCDAMLVVISPQSMASTNVEDEWQFYLDKGKLVIPVLWRPADVHFQINRLQYVDFHRQDYDKALKQLHGELTGHGIRLNPISSVTTLSDSNARMPRKEPLRVRGSRKRFQSIGMTLGALALIVVVGVAVLFSGVLDGESPGEIVGQLTETASPTLTGTSIRINTPTNTPPPSNTPPPTNPPTDTPPPSNTPSQTPSPTLTPSITPTSAEIAALGQSIAQNPGNPEFIFSRAVAYYEVGDYPAAIADYTRVTEIEPGFAGTYLNRGLAYHRLGNYAAAIADYDLALSLDSTLALAYNNRGGAYSDLGNYSTAIADFDQAIGLAPEYSEAYNNRGLAYVGLGNYDAAFADYNRAIELSPEYANAYNNRAWHYHRTGDLARALTDFDQALELVQNVAEEADMYIGRGNLFYDLGDYEGALADYREFERIAAQVDPLVVEQIVGQLEPSLEQQIAEMEAALAEEGSAT